MHGHCGHHAEGGKASVPVTMPVSFSRGDVASVPVSPSDLRILSSQSNIDTYLIIYLDVHAV